MTSIFQGQPLKTRPFRTKRGSLIWVPGVHQGYLPKNVQAQAHFFHVKASRVASSRKVPGKPGTWQTSNEEDGLKRVGLQLTAPI